MPRRTTALTAVALSLLPLGQPLLSGTLGFAAATAAVVLHQGAADAQDASAVARVAKAITVRIEGATHGSGVLVKRDGNRYTVLTAWHVVGDNRPGEEVGIYTRDGNQHQLEQGSIQRLGQVDMAVLTFSSPVAYEMATIGDIKNVSSGNPIFVSGFPLPTSSVPASIWRFLDGKVVANATVAIPDGYQLLYSNPTLPGMSGGAVLNSQGQLVGIHGKAERDDQVSMRTGKAVATGTNQGMPISYYRQFNSGQTVVAINTQATSADDFLAQANSILSKGLNLETEDKSKFRKVIQLSNASLEQRPNNDLAYAFRARANVGIGEYQDAIADANESVTLNPRNSSAYFARGNAKSALKNYQGAIADFNKAIAIDPQLDFAYLNRGNAKSLLKDYQGAIADFNKAIAIDPKYALLYYNRGNAKSALKDYQGAIADFNKAIAIDPEHVSSYANRGSVKRVLKDYQGAIADFNKAIAINPEHVTPYVNRGSVRSILKNYQEAIDDFNKAIAIDPENATAYLNRGYAKENLKDYQGAISDSNQAIAINPGWAGSYLVRMRARVGLSDYRGACADLKKAVSLGSEDMLQYLNSDSGIWCRNMR